MLANFGNDGRHNGSVGESYSADTLDLNGMLGDRNDRRECVMLFGS